MKKKKDKEEKKADKPTTRKYMLYCENCSSSSEHFLTNFEVYNKRVRLVWCRVCDKMTCWKMVVC